MTGILIRWLITTLAILAVPYLISGVRVESFGSAMLTAAILGILNALVRPILIILTLPLTILTLGLFILDNQRPAFSACGSYSPGNVCRFILVGLFRFHHSEHCFVGPEFGGGWRKRRKDHYGLET